MGVCCYCRALSKRAFFSKPWEHVIFGVFGGGYVFNKIVSGEEYWANMTERLIQQKMDRNKGVLDDKYRAILGEERYAKYLSR